MTSLRVERGAVFVDRDGVICENRPDHVTSWSEFVFVPGAVEALASLSRAKVPLYIVTNQAVVGRGLLSRRSLDQIHEKMLGVLYGSGATVASILVCPHHPDDQCACRKPNPGLLREAEARFDIDLKRSFMIGDAATDIEAGQSAGTTTILVKTGRGADTVRRRGAPKADFVAEDLVDAAIWILSQKAVRIGRTEVRTR